MDRNLVYSKTPAGEEATRQRTRVVQRNQRMVLLQVDGQLTVAGLVEKIGNETLVVNALRELERDGFVALSLEAHSVWEENKKRIREVRALEASRLSQFSNFDSTASKSSTFSAQSKASQFSDFDKPVKPALEPRAPYVPGGVSPPPSRPGQPGLGERFASWLAGLKVQLNKNLGGTKAPAPPKAVKLHHAVNWKKRIALGLLGVVLAAFLVFYLYPYDNHRQQFESAIGQAVGVPVRIGRVDIQLTPRVGLALSDVRMGSKGEARIGKILFPQLWALKSEQRVQLQEIELSDLMLTAEFFAATSNLAERMRDASAFSLDRARLKNVTLQFGASSLRELSGDLKLGETGGQLILSLESADRGLQVRLRPTPSGVTVKVEGINWKPKEDSLLTFSYIDVKGVLRPGKLLLESVDLGLLDGGFQGSWVLDFAQGVAVSGQGSLERISLKRLGPALGIALDAEGALSGKVRMQAAGRTWEEMLSKAEGDLAFRVDSGVFNGADLGEATRRVGSSVRGGMTKFDHLTGTLLVNEQSVRVDGLELDAGLVRASGNFLVKRKDQAVDGSVLVTIRSSVSPIQMPVRINGNLPTLQAEVGR